MGWRRRIAGAVDGLLAVTAGGTPLSAADYSLRFHGNGFGDIDRVKIQLDDPANSLPGPPVDVGATDFTIEFWMKADAAENPATGVACGFNVNWIYGNIILDRDRYNQDRKFGLSLASGVMVFGVSGNGTGDFTICGTATVLDGAWHHVAIDRRRADGWLWLFVDGQLDAQGDGPDGEVSYPDDGVPGDYCGGPCLASDPYLIIGAEKHDAGAAYPSYRGRVCVLRVGAGSVLQTMTREDEIRAEDATLKKLRRLVDRTAFLLANMPMTDQARDELLIATRRKAVELIPDQMDIYTLIYEARFYRLIAQFGGRHNLREPE